MTTATPMHTRLERTPSAADFGLIAEWIPHIVWMAGANGSTEYFNRRGTEYTGLWRQIDGWDWLSLIHPDDADRVKGAWQQAVRTETPYELDSRLRGAD